MRCLPRALEAAKGSTLDWQPIDGDGDNDSISRKERDAKMQLSYGQA